MIGRNRADMGQPHQIFSDNLEYRFTIAFAPQGNGGRVQADMAGQQALVSDGGFQKAVQLF
ncbi:hypothetical protein GCM10027037_23170 [Mucilaginibacter koreensis]